MLKNIEYKNIKQLKAIEDQGNKNINTGSKSLKSIGFVSGLSPDAEFLLKEIKEENDDIDSNKLFCTESDGKIFNINTFKTLLKFASSIYNGKVTLNDQYKIFEQLKDLEEYDPGNLDRKNLEKKDWGKGDV